MEAGAAKQYLKNQSSFLEPHYVKHTKETKQEIMQSHVLQFFYS